MQVTPQPEPDKPLHHDVGSIDIVEAKRELLCSSLACLIVFLLLLGCTVRGIVPSIYTIALGIVLTSAILVKLISIYRSSSGAAARVSPEHAANAGTDAQSGDSPIVTWIGIVPVPMSKQGYLLFLIILLFLTVVAGIVATWVRQHIF